MKEKEQGSKTVQTIWEAGKWILSIGTILILIGCLLFIRASGEDSTSVLGFKTLLVLSDSMKETDFETGDLILIRETDPDTITAGQIVCYRSMREGSYNERITHKVRKVTEDASGKKVFITYGTTTDSDDPDPVYPDQIEGVYWTTIPLVGKIASSVNTVEGYLLFVLVPFSVLIIVEALELIIQVRKIYRKQRCPVREEGSSDGP